MKRKIKNVCLLLCASLQLGACSASGSNETVESILEKDSQNSQKQAEVKVTADMEKIKNEQAQKEKEIQEQAAAQAAKEAEEKRKAEPDDAAIQSMVSFGAANIGMADVYSKAAELDPHTFFFAVFNEEIFNRYGLYSYFYGNSDGYSNNTVGNEIQITYPADKINLLMKEVFDLDAQSLFAQYYQSGQNTYTYTVAAGFGGTTAGFNTEEGTLLGYTANGQDYTFYFVSNSERESGHIFERTTVYAVRAEYKPDQTLMPWTLTGMDTDLSGAPENVRMIDALIRQSQSFMDSAVSWQITFADINKDGNIELFLADTGPKEMPFYKYKIYTFNGSTYEYFDEVPAYTHSIEIDENGDILLNYAKQGIQNVYRLSMVNGSIVQDEIYSQMDQNAFYKEYGQLPVYYYIPKNGDQPDYVYNPNMAGEQTTDVITDLILWMNQSVNAATYTQSNGHIVYSGQPVAAAASSSASKSEDTDITNPAVYAKTANHSDISSLPKLSTARFNFSGPCIAQIILKTRGVDIGQDVLVEAMGIQDDGDTVTYQTMAEVLNKKLKENKVQAFYYIKYYEQSEVSDAVASQMFGIIDQNLKDGYPTVVFLYDFLSEDREKTGGIYGLVYGSGTQNGQMYYSVYIPKMHADGYDAVWSKSGLLDMMKAAKYFLYLG